MRTAACCLAVLSHLLLGAAGAQAAAPAPFGHTCTAQDGIRFCPSATLGERVPSWDGTPIDIDVSLPPTGDGPFPTVVIAMFALAISLPRSLAKMAMSSMNVHGAVGGGFVSRAGSYMAARQASEALGAAGMLPFNKGGGWAEGARPQTQGPGASSQRPPVAPNAAAASTLGASAHATGGSSPSRSCAPAIARPR